MSRTIVPAMMCGVFALAGLVAPSALAAGGDARGGREFLKAAVVGDNGEIALGKLAQRRASSAEVRSFARVIVNDHGRSRLLAMDLALSIGLAEPTGNSAATEVGLRRLRALNGKAFDREFVRLMAEDHRKDIHDYRAQAARRQGRVSRLAQMSVPMLRKHLRMAEALALKVGLRQPASSEQS